ncbi:TPA: hypothetical protein I9165_001906 [Clostridioides difficile]|nr:hypothetical protein [Clostridioides difficile]HAT4872652.1 hypothetical protein [Clostridioides difficile]HAT5944604.1 hypothetical protein [Clostridioides difficile]
MTTFNTSLWTNINNMLCHLNCVFIMFNYYYRIA